MWSHIASIKHEVGKTIVHKLPIDTLRIRVLDNVLSLNIIGNDLLFVFQI